MEKWMITNDNKKNQTYSKKSCQHYTHNKKNLSWDEFNTSAYSDTENNSQTE